MSDIRDPEPRPAVYFSILGPLSAEVRGRTLQLGPLKQRLVLAMLLCRPNVLVSVDVLTEAVWDDEPPRTARKNLQVYISALRKTLAEAGEGQRLISRPGGYLLKLADSELDSLQFRALARAGRAAADDGDTELGARLLDRARRLWTGPPLPELVCSEPIRDEVARLTTRYLAVCEDWSEVALEAGQAREVADIVGTLVEQHPLRERLRSAQMTALHRSGRRTEALSAYDELRQYLSRELGLSPSPVLESVYRSILSDRGVGTGRPHAGVGGRRGTPTVLPPDIADFTGRADQMRKLLEVAGPGGTVTVVIGAAGVGKSALADRAAHRLADEFPGGRIRVSLREKDGSPRSLARLTAELLPYTNPTGPLPADPEHAAALWRAWLAQRKVLLLLDDTPDEASVRPLLPGTGPSAAIITARTQLAGLAPAHRMHLSPYSTAEALELLGRLIGPGRVLCDRPAAERIVAACGMLPLAVRAAGLKLAVLRHLPLGEYAVRLADPRRVLDELTVGDVDVRSHLDDAWRQLDESRRSMLRRLARLPLSEMFTIEEAVVALGCGQDQAQRELELMIEQGIVVSPGSEVTAHSAAYSLPHLTHLHAREATSDELVHGQP
ncbi:BTAD domain-containing putative transcriptional regulator [Streptomyces sp. NPDC006476]|uniref:AfsR/SARP family transcriptional regulator n=1 Tax=Streptomyces sp. NPDC006476 TaxID=3157175 RepID=UPI0033B2E4CC